MQSQCVIRHDSDSSSSPPNRTALLVVRCGTTNVIPAAAALPRSFPRNLANNPPPPPLAENRVGVSGGPLDATVDALAVSGVTLELVVVVVVVVVGFLSAERVGGGKRRDGRVVDGGGGEFECERECKCACDCDCDCGRGRVGTDALRWRRAAAVVGGYKVGARWAGRCGVRERWSPIAICW